MSESASVLQRSSIKFTLIPDVFPNHMNLKFIWVRVYTSESFRIPSAPEYLPWSQRNTALLDIHSGKAFWREKQHTPTTYKYRLTQKPADTRNALMAVNLCEENFSFAQFPHTTFSF